MKSAFIFVIATLLFHGHCITSQLEPDQYIGIDIDISVHVGNKK